MRSKAISRSKCSVFLFTLFMGLYAYAASSAALSIRANETQIKAGRSLYKNNKAKNSDSLKSKIELEVKAISYVESSKADSQSQQQAQLGLNLKKEGSFFAETNLIIGSFTEPNSFYYAFPEAYAAYGKPDSYVAIGRKKENLSFADSFFNFGLIQSHFTNDNINFIEGGLSGISASYSAGGIGVIGNFMPIFIPNQGPPIKIEDGRIVTSNRWAAEPPAKFKFGSEYKNINYAIRDYQIFDIISNSGYMLHAYAGQNKTRPVIIATYAKKPINEIVLSRDTFGDISNFEGYVFLTPVVLTHEVRALDLNWDYKNLKTSFSYLADQPQNTGAKDLETIQTLSPLNIYSIFSALDLSYYFAKKFEIYAGVAIISGGEIKDLNSAQQESFIAVAHSRIQFKKPLKLGLKSELFTIDNQAVETDLNMTYDQELKGSLLSAQFKYTVKYSTKYSSLKKMQISLGADVIGVENDLPSRAQGNFLDQNKANDRFFAGLNYVF